MPTIGQPITLSANGNTALGDGSDSAASIMSIQLVDPGSMSLTLKIQGTVDGTNYEDLLMTPSNSATPVTSATAEGIWTVDVSALAGVQANVTNFVGEGTLTFRPVIG